MSEVREDAKAKAKRLNLDLFKPGPSDVYVDIDSAADRMIFDIRFGLLLKLWPMATVRFTTSPSGIADRQHAYVVVPELAPLGEHERIALQAALNSDPFREMLAIFHGRAGYKHTSVFFEKPNPTIAGVGLLDSAVEMAGGK